MQDSTPATPDRITAVARVAAVVCTLALIALGLGWELVWAPTGRGTLAWKVLPLAFAISGLLKHRMYTYRWLSLLVWIYVAEGLVRLHPATPTTFALALTEAVLGVLLFAACATEVRWRIAQSRRRAASAT